MKKFLLLLILVVAIIVIASMVIAPKIENGIEDSPATEGDSLSVAATCENNNGTWLSEYKECEYISQTWCEENDGVFTGCGSACRHEALDSPSICTQQCVPLCKFGAEALSEDIARSLAIANWGDCEECDELTINIVDNQIEAIYEGLKDDSVKTVKRIATISQEAGIWMLNNEQSSQFICQAGRGQAEFSVDLCD